MASNLPQRELMTTEQMTDALVAKRDQVKNQMYPAAAAAVRNAEIANTVFTKSELLKDSVKYGRVSLVDTNLPEVMERCEAYFTACANASILPSIGGVAVFALGITRQGLYGHLKRNPDSKVSRYLGLVRDAIGDMMLEMGSKKTISDISMIFILRNGYGFKNIDSPDVEIQDDEKRPKTVEEIRQKYADFE